jgi:hypothetical protein
LTHTHAWHLLQKDAALYTAQQENRQLRADLRALLAARDTVAALHASLAQTLN